MPYLRQIDANAWYSNHGPLAVELQSRLAARWSVQRGEVTLLANGTLALTLALLASGARPGSVCLMPSWTFVATAGAVRQAGLVPHFVDVCWETWAPDPAEVQLLASRLDVGAVVVVSPFGAPLDLAAWERVHAVTGLPVIIDAAAAFDTLRPGGPMQAGKCPVVVSLHATKVFGVGEGGALICRDPDTMERARRLAQFGFLGTREASLAGMNAKMSEYTAAVGLAGLDMWPETRARWATVTGAYLARLQLGCGVTPSPSFGTGWVGSTLNVLWPAEQPSPVDALTAEGVGTLPWWGQGCHAHPAYRGCAAEPLPVTTALASRSVGLPFWQDLTSIQIDRVCVAVARACGGHARVAVPARSLVPA